MGAGLPDVQGVEEAFAQILAELLKPETPAEGDDDFFLDLGADSMVMARFCARLRKRPELPSPSMKDVYENPTLRMLAVALADDAPATGPKHTVHDPAPVPGPRAGTGAYLLCGALQLTAFLVYTLLAAVAAETGYQWITSGEGPVDLYLRSVAVGGIFFAGVSALPIAAKWLLVGRWTEREIQIWSVTYVRFWIVKTLIRTNPLILLATGSPLYVLYLRALGAKVGRGVTILATGVPVATDLLTIGDGAVVRKDAALNGYHAYDGWIRTGPITLGRGSFVGEATVVDIGTRIGDGAQLGHASSLHTGQTVPDGESWHGTPARPTTVDHRRVPEADCGPWRRARYTGAQLFSLLALYLPLSIGGVDVVVSAVGGGGEELTGAVAPTGRDLVLDALAFSYLLLFTLLVAGLAVAVVLPRILRLGVRPERVYPLYGLAYSLHRTVLRLTNLKFFAYLFGDSSYIVPYLRAIGYQMRNVRQTGSNFGTGVKHETPFLSVVGSGTMVADGLSMMNAEYSATSFRVRVTEVGANSFLGNRIAYPAGGRTGENVLLATKVLVPMDGPVRENTGLLGSPSFEIPRTVLRDGSFAHLETGPEFRRRLRRKNAYNARSMGLALLVRWMHLFGISVLALFTAGYHERFGALALAGQILASLVFTVVFFVLVERSAAGFRRLQPRFCSIYEPYFWWHERYWKLVVPEWERIFAGTPFKNLVSRALGVRLGRRVFDDGCFLPERTLVAIGDDTCLNAGTVIQSHSQEDGAFKSDHSEVGARCTLGPGAFVHYGVRVGDGALIGPDSFLMKGEEVPSGAHWAGNPAREQSAVLSTTRPVLNGATP